MCQSVLKVVCKWPFDVDYQVMINISDCIKNICYYLIYVVYDGYIINDVIIFILSMMYIFNEIPFFRSYLSMLTCFLLIFHTSPTCPPASPNIRHINSHLFHLSFFCTFFFHPHLSRYNMKRSVCKIRIYSCVLFE